MSARLPTPRAALAFALLAIALHACAGCSGAGGGNGTAAQSPTPAESPLPPEWAGKTNPLPDDAGTVERGHGLFLKNCAPCHGENADGKGPAAVGVTPAPANFRDGVRLSSHSDAYLFMRISTGKHGTAMPAFGATLSEDDRWAILRFLRSIPGAKEKGT